MSQADDRRAIWILAFVALLGAGVRVVSGEKVSPGDIGSSAARVERPSIDSLSARARRVGAPLAPGEKVDLDVAPAFEIARLSGIGPRMASRIVAIRDSIGSFGSIEVFDGVPGVGPALLEAVAGSVTFSRPRVTARVRGGGRVPVNRASVAALSTLPGIGPAKAQAIVEYIERNGPLRSPSELTRVPGIGPATLDGLRERVTIP
jgi:competence ComEA-like helix-hairpin-helix protein